MPPSASAHDNPQTKADLQRIIREILKSSILFQGFTSEDLEYLIPLCEMQFFNTGDILIRQGDQADHRVFFLLIGSVSIDVDQKYILTLQRPWDIFGEMSLCSSAPRSASVTADTLVQVLVLDASVIHHPEQARNYQFKYYFYNMFASIMSWKLQQTSERAKLYEDALMQAQQMHQYSTGLEQKLADNLQQTLLYGHLVKSVQEGVLVLSLEGIITLVNPAAQELLSASSGDLVGRPLQQFIHHCHEANLPDILRKARQDERWAGEVEVINGLAQIFPAYASFSRVKNRQEDPLALSCVLRDIRGQKAYEQQILQQNQALEEAYQHLQTLDKLKDDFLTLMSHELRTPLSSILAYSESLITPELVTPAEQPSFLQAIHSQAKRLETMINNVLDLSKLESGQLHFTFAPDNWAELIQQIVPAYQAQAAAQGLAFNLEIPAISPTFNFDRERIGQVMHHLLNNALKFTPQGSVKVCLQTLPEHSLLRVQDSGIGIAAADLPKVFNRFEQIEDMSLHHQGLGLGMPLSRLIVEAHQGQLWVESQPQQGTSFYVKLPHDLPNTLETLEFSEDDLLTL